MVARSDRPITQTEAENGILDMLEKRLPGVYVDGYLGVMMDAPAIADSMTVELYMDYPATVYSTTAERKVVLRVTVLEVTG